MKDQNWSVTALIKTDSNHDQVFTINGRHTFYGGFTLELTVVIVKDIYYSTWAQKT